MTQVVNTQSLPQGRARTVMIVVLFASNMLASLSQSLMNVALDAVSTAFSITLSQANWMVLGYTIVAATTITMAASLLKRYGLRLMMLVSYVFALIGSILGFIAWNYPVMIVARLLQAVCTGLCFPIITAALMTISPEGKSGTLLAINSGVIGIGLAFTPVLSGLIITYVGIHELFLVPAVMAVLLIIVRPFCIHNLYERQHAPIDILSVLLSFAGLACFMYGLNEISHELFPPLVILIVGVIIMAAFVYRQLHIKDPLLNLKPFGYRIFSVGEILVVMAYMSSIFMSLLIPLYLEGAVAMTPFMVGVVCIIPVLCYAVCCFPSGHIQERHGVWPLVPGGFAVVLIAFIGIYFASSNIWIIPLLIFVAIAFSGIGFLFPGLKTENLESLPREISSHGSSIHSTLVQIASSVSSALYVGVMSGDVTRMMADGATKASAYAFGFSHALLISIGVLVTAIVVSFVYVRLTRSKPKKLAKQNTPAAKK